MGRPHQQVANRELQRARGELGREDDGKLFPRALTKRPRPMILPSVVERRRGLLLRHHAPVEDTHHPITARGDRFIVRTDQEEGP